MRETQRAWQLLTVLCGHQVLQGRQAQGLAQGLGDALCLCVLPLLHSYISMVSWEKSGALGSLVACCSRRPPNIHTK